MMAPLEARCLTHLEDIEALRSRWQVLAEDRSSDRPFTSPGFFLAALKTYHLADKPRIWLVERGGQLEAVLPLVDRPLRRYRMAIQEVGCPFNPNYILNDPLLPADESSAASVAECLLRGIADDDFQTLLFDHLPVANGVAGRIRSAAVRCGYGCDPVRASRTLYRIQVQSTFDEFLATRSAQHRWQLKKNRRRVLAEGSEVHHLRTRQEIAPALPDWWRVVRSSWQAGALDGKAVDREETFARHLLAELPDDEVGELWLMSIRGRPAAALRMLAGKNRIAVHTMHYDPELRALAPGTVLFEDMLRDAWRRGLSVVDMHGNTPFFQRWATHSSAYHSLRLYRPGFVGSLIRSARSFAKTVATRAERLSHRAAGALRDEAEP